MGAGDSVATDAASDLGGSEAATAVAAGVDGATTDEAAGTGDDCFSAAGAADCCECAVFAVADSVLVGVGSDLAGADTGDDTAAAAAGEAATAVD